MIKRESDQSIFNEEICLTFLHLHDISGNTMSTDMLQLFQMMAQLTGALSRNMVLTNSIFWHEGGASNVK